MRKLLYSNGSPFARRVRILLVEKHLDYEGDVYDGIRPVENILSHNPALQVPVLYDEGQHLWGTNLIIDYLVATYPDPRASVTEAPLSPSITREARHWEDRLILETADALAHAVVNIRPITIDTEAKGVRFIDRHQTRIGTCLDWLETQIHDKGFWPGTFSVMDINLLCPLLYAEDRGIFDFRTGQWPKVAAMVDSWGLRQSVLSTAINAN
ncbi:MAG: glutathione S-transferase family protein [Hyphomicrobiaceae bacterium]